MICDYCGSPILRNEGERPHRYRRRKFCSKRCGGLAKGRGAIRVDKHGRARFHTPDGGTHLYTRAVMEAHLKRPLASAELVHHVNGDCSDDRIENLRLTTRKGHIAIHREQMNFGKRQQSILKAQGR